MENGILQNARRKLLEMIICAASFLERQVIEEIVAWNGRHLERDV